MLVTAVDEAYLRSEGRYLIQSCQRYAPEQHFHLHLVNADPAIDDEIRSWHGRISIEHARVPYDEARWKGLMCCARTQPLLQVLRGRREPTIYLDSDILLRGPLDDLFARLARCDLMVLHRPQVATRGALGSEHAGKFNSGVIAVRPTDAGLRFAERYAARVAARIASGEPLDHRDGGVYTAVDQEALYLTWEAMRDEIRFEPLESRFNDSRFGADSPIWHGKGTARRRLAYRSEKARYQNRLARLALAGGAAIQAGARRLLREAE